MTTTSTSRRQGINSSAAIKLPCLMATTANITLSGLQTIDGVVGAANDRVLVKNQTTAADNGIYEMNSSTWSRAPDFDGAYDVVTGTLIGIVSGTVSGGYYYKVTNTGTVTIGTTSLTFALTSLAPVTQSAAAYTPVISGTTVAGAGTYTAQVGYYVKTGVFVNGHVFLNWSAHTGSGNFLISIPFAAKNIANLSQAISVGEPNGIALTAGNVISGYIAPGASNISLSQSPTGGGASSAVPLDTSASIILSFSYITDV